MSTNPFAGWRPPLPQTLAAAGFVHALVDVGDGVTLSVVQGPRRGRPALLLLPAQMGTWHSWALVLEPLSAVFDVDVLELRGHGASTWTCGRYDWNIVSGDVVRYIEAVVQRPAFIAGNSSGGIVALWCAANAPEVVAGIVLEDAPVFSVEWPRFRDRDRFVFNGLAAIADALGDVEHRNVDRVVDVAIEGACACGCSDVRLRSPQRHQVFELPELKPIITEHRMQRGWCKGCNRRTRRAQAPSRCRSRRRQ